MSPGKKKKKKSSSLLTVVLVLIFTGGLALILYPTVSDMWNSYHQARAIASYVSTVEEMSAEEYGRILSEAREYNSHIKDRENVFLMSEEEYGRYQKLLNISGNGIMAYIEIPSIGVNLPVYHGTEETVLQVASGHIDWTSLPVGGESTHAAISGHTGLPKAKLFTDIDKLKEGDLFTVHVLKEVLTYEVYQISVVEPEDTELLKIEDGADCCTLVTCTPYGINSHRLLVRGRRTETVYEEEETEETVAADAERIDTPAVMLVAGAVCLVIILISTLFIRK